VIGNPHELESQPAPAFIVLRALGYTVLIAFGLGVGAVVAVIVGILTGLIQITC
jgi:hypothetical protein